MKLDSEKLARVYRKCNLPNEEQIVLIDAPTDGSWSKADCYFNIYRIDSSGEVIWQIEAVESRFDSDTFVGMRLENGILKASTFHGIEFKVDVQSGISEEAGWRK